MTFDHRFTDTVTVKSQTGVNSHGDPTYGAASAVSARVQRGKDRDDDSIDHVAVIYSATEIKVDDRIWLPGETTTDDDKARKAVKVSVSPSLDGSYKLYKSLLE